MTVKEFRELFKGEIKFFDYATGEAIGEEFKTEENERLQELEIANMELGLKDNPNNRREYLTFMKVFEILSQYEDYEVYMISPSYDGWSSPWIDLYIDKES